MLERIVIKIAGASGQGINTVGEILSLALKRAGFSICAYREYPSLIKGGHATYQIDFAAHQIHSSLFNVDIVIVLNKQSTNWHLAELRNNGLIFHDIDNPRISNDEAEIMTRKNIKLVYIPALSLASAVGGNDLTTNIVTLGAVWKILNLNISLLQGAVRNKFSTKPQIVETDINCLSQGFNFQFSTLPNYKSRLLKVNEIGNEAKSNLHIHSLLEIANKYNPEPNLDFKTDFLITGNIALGLGAINSGIRIYYSYPMTPTSPILEYLADMMHETGMIVKQAEDEITAAAMALGSMYMGTRALTATSGGGFDLMTEHLSLAGMTEIPFVVILGQRPGPATGLPTWTAQSDLFLAIFSAHGEFSRYVVAPSDPADAFYTIQEAFNIAEELQMPVIILTDKLLGENLYNVKALDENKIPLLRGLISDSNLETITSTARYELNESGVSSRWLPGSSKADYNTNGDEHDSAGNTTEDADITEMMLKKRLLKSSTLLQRLPEPEIYFNNVDLFNNNGRLRFISWGSNLGVIKDTLAYFEDYNVKVDYIHIKHLWPLKTSRIINFFQEWSDTILVEANSTAQLGKLIKMETGIEIKNKLLKWNGRPFNLEEILQYIKEHNFLTINFN